MAMSTQLAKFIIIYSEVINIPMVKYFKQTVIIILTGLCGVCGLSTFVVADYALDKSWWWLRHGTTMFYITTSYAGIISAMYFLVGADLTFKLAPLSKRDAVKEKSVLLKRIGLMKRSVIVFIVVVVMATASVFYANNPSVLNQSIFSITCGATEAEAECEAVPPDLTGEKCKQTTAVTTEEILLKPIVSSSAAKPPTTPRKSVSFHSDLVTGCAVIEEGSDSPEVSKGGHIVRASYYQNPPSDPAQGCLQEIVTTRVCLELGLLQDNANAPTVMVCNVDIEPSTRTVVSIQDRENGNYIEEDKCEENNDVLNRISDDLDYLLNTNISDRNHNTDDETHTPL
ncbi:hypothetical protein O3M35_001069 [Rhynocoris fuscipes]|uniref:Transmembrane protein n=1 Tax=Rhynocoris fuscipes TaxID=488301 RepID=A0AAW1DT61_9HEMI